ncbi:MAG: MptD family putative ECF transporter S component [Saccharofermentans sp.]|jgi:energy-coupling factor transport system substrate-specific component|nr:MptD family putative ECF transporter S component [Saccharofermentans sp.]
MNNNSNRLKGKDLITVGIYTALYTVCVFITGMFNAIPIFYPIYMFVGPLLMGIPMALYYLKIEKFGMLTISGIIMAFFWYIAGYTWISVACIVPASLLADIFLKVIGYKKFGAIITSYIFFSMGILAGPANLWFAGAGYWDGIRESMGEQYASQLAMYMPVWFLPIAVVLIAVGAVCGALVGRKMLNKHFKKAGIV